ncbi:DUF6483 family protein [Desulfosporosinus nitroreducens]|uniref:DUF6483 family protein n=1 Tax=Desulfosporosinus nitroreducens TaxID=2018668 RepID=A0ABT8QKF7_9FIRM|nr:DUF6483 family protein [Desulfosporosinus nitroreducens]MCO1600517.1 DUF6483 family protein [Desulfosporosinus nitroreducens]MDO0821605.1 DUF6483 family protein [Desulfosporosinus nitroreducens]
MYQKDYIMKMIEQLTMAIATLLGSKSKSKIDECHQMVNEALYDLTGMSEGTLLKLSHKDLISIISGGKETNTEKCFALAEMLKLKADVSKDDSVRSFALYLKSLNIFIELNLAQSLHVQNSYQTINEIIDLIKPYKIPRESNQLLFQYYEFIGQYDKAEDVLFKMITANEKDEIIINEGFAFYNRLKGKTLMDLEGGNLPLDEVIEGLEVYQHLLNNQT